MPTSALDIVCLTLLALLLLGTVALRVRVRSLGDVQAGEDLGLRIRKGGTIATAIAVGAIWILGPQEAAPSGAALVGVLGAIVLAVVRPGGGDAELRVDGVRRGWILRRFEELEEWRLIGEHLRFRLFGTWTAVPAPPEQHADLRRILQERAAGRESAFGHGIEGPDPASAKR